MKTISIIGGGWLGKPLGQYLSSIGHKVYVSKTTSEGVEALTQSGVDGFRCDLNQGATELSQHLTATASEIVIGCFPPGFRKGAGDQYLHHWKALIEAAKESKAKRVVMVSSTTVYPSLATDMVEEDATLAQAEQNPLFSDNGTIMLRAEEALISSGLNFAIVRCSGLVGPNRHPARFASKLKQVSQKAPANMIHLQDAIGAISFMALTDISTTVNATTPNTVSKAEFYQAALNAVGSAEPLPPITQQADKRIVANKLSELGYRFHFKHTLELV
ncbi:nucleoside-diphosphate sugar epimerase [Vibrio galatheae]|uniref:Nucleoside-diphosphate sugar epimerase n=1 Tax=Vibrio galatheae TaxID=579748 RepID=A0A0F4NJ75_9VIBR|nr:NAD(P)H-binding protein [Vibrio galatheae]KJY83162.1 nucleoside-diphosphate sugar epimerase [Vibrio galatheae]